MLEWDVYEISHEEAAIAGMKFRGRVRKFGLTHNIDVLAENAADAPGRVRIAVRSGMDITPIREFTEGIVPGVRYERIFTGIQNPILSKKKCNVEDRYTL